MVKKIGIPRALLYYKYYPFWKTFLEELRCEVITSTHTTQKILQRGVKYSMDESCLALKVFCGHVLDLIDKGVDYLFIPRIESVERKHFVCTKFLGLPDIVRNSIKKTPPILSPNIDFNRRFPYQSMFSAGWRLTKNPFRIHTAYWRARKKEQNFERTLKTATSVSEVMELIETGQIRKVNTQTHPVSKGVNIAVIGHPYNVYDDLVNLGIIKKLEKKGVNVLTQEMVPQEVSFRAASRVSKDIYWTYQKEIFGASLHFVEKGVDGIIFIISFPCGPDSLTIEYAIRQIKNSVPILSLVIDEHQTDTGIMTRLESFIDLIKMGKEKTTPVRKNFSDGASLPVPHLTQQTGNGKSGLKITFPHMGDYYVCFKSLFETLGHEVVVPPPITKRTIELGCKHSPEFVCFPFKITLGCLIEGLEQGADILLQSGSKGSCRYGEYKPVQEQILKDLGYKFRFMRFSSFGDFKAINKNVTNLQILQRIRIAWAKLRAIEKFESEVWRLSACEVNIGETRRLYQKFLNSCDQANTKDQVKRVEKEYSERFNQIKTVPGFRPIKVGIIGEIYIVIEPYSNLDIEKELGQMRVEVVRPLCLGQTVKEMLCLSLKKTTFQRISRSYLQYNSGAHANASVAETIIFAHEGLDGAIHIKPHACMPEVTAMGALHRVSKDYNIPILFFSFDENATSVGVRTRLEAFVELLKRKRERKCILA